MGENVISILAKWLLFTDDIFASSPLFSWSADPKLTTDDSLLECILSVDNTALLTEKRLADKDEELALSKALIAENWWGKWTLSEHNPLYTL